MKQCPLVTPPHRYIPCDGDGLWAVTLNSDSSFLVSFVEFLEARRHKSIQHLTKKKITFEKSQIKLGAAVGIWQIYPDLHPVLLTVHWFFNYLSTICETLNRGITVKRPLTALKQSLLCRMTFFVMHSLKLFQHFYIKTNVGSISVKWTEVKSLSSVIFLTFI